MRDRFRILLKHNISKVLSPSLEALRNRLQTFPSDIIIYGAGGGGSVMFNLLRGHSLKPLFFLDRNAEQIGQKDGLSVLLPDSCLIENTLREKALVLLAITLREKERLKIIENLKAWGYKNIIDAQELNALNTGFTNGSADTWSENKENILQALGLMADCESIETYVGNVSAHALRDYSHCTETSEDAQYFLKHVPFTKGFSRFIDCGAYTGDTLKTLVDTYSPVEAYAGFEPFIPVYEKLSVQAGVLAEQIKHCLLIPCAVSGKNAAVALDDDAPGSSSISSGGNAQITAVKIDDILKIFAPTFIKMDVEGAEYDALLGAKDTISTHKPDLAVCVYHFINHIWDIPLLIDSWNLGYKFYLRAHSSATIETVLYAVSD